MKFAFNVTSLAVFVALSGCSLMPEVVQINSRLPDHYAAPAPISKSEGCIPAKWYKLYGDEELNRLVDLAVPEVGLEDANGNAEVAAAYARLAQAMAVFVQLDAGKGPSFSMGLDHSRQSSNVAGQRSHASAASLSALAEYELDIWGKLNNQSQAGLERFMASAFEVSAARKSVIHRVVSEYWSLRELERAEALLTQRIEAREAQLTIMSSRWRLGAGTVLDVTQASAEVAALERERIEVRSSRALAERALALLTGVPDLKVSPSKADAVYAGLPSYGLPSSLLANRVDIKQAEALLHAAGFEVAVARAALFPSISLQAQGGEQSVSLGSLMGGGSSFWGLGLKIDLALFDRGLRKAKIKQSQAVQRELLVAYQQTIRKAFTDVSNALILRSSLESQVPWLEQELTSANRAMDMAQLQYDAGRLSYAQLLDVRQALDTARRDRVNVQYALLTNHANLLHALGY